MTDPTPTPSEAADFVDNAPWAVGTGHLPEGEDEDATATVNGETP